MKTEKKTPGVIEPHCLYTRDELQARMRWGPAAVRQAQRKGLISKQIGRNKYYLGSDIIAFVEQAGEA